MAHNGGRGVTNQDFFDGTSGQPFINMLKQASMQGAATGSSTRVNGEWPSLIAANGYPTAMPSAPANLWAMVFYGRVQVGDVYRLKYPSQHTVALAAINNTSFSTSGPAGDKTYTVTSTSVDQTAFTSIFSVRITAMSGNDWTGGISFFRAEDETDFDAGKIFKAEYLAAHGYPDSPVGIIRHMNWSNTNKNYSRDLSLFPQADDLTWNDERFLSAPFWAGVASRSADKNDYTTGAALPGAPGSWVDGKTFGFRLGTAMKTISVTATTGNPTTINCAVAHNLTTGDKIVFANAFGSYPTAWRSLIEYASFVTGLIPEHTITVTDADHFTIPINSTGFASLGTVVVYPSPTITDGTLTAKRIVTGGFNISPHSGSFASGNDYHVGIYDDYFDAVQVPTSGSNNQKATVPISVMCEFANVLGAHSWHCLPYNFNDTAIADYYEVVDQYLDAGLLAYMEIGNEVWNSAFAAYGHARVLSSKEYDVENTGNGYGWMVARMSDAIQAVAPDQARWRAVYAAQNVDTAYSTLLQCAAYSGGNSALYPGNKVDVISTAPYYNTKFTYSGTAASYAEYVATVLEWRDGNPNVAYRWLADELTTGPAEPGNTTNQVMAEHFTTYVPGWITAKASYTGRRGVGLTYVPYEGGLHWVGPNDLDGGFPSGGAEVVDVQNMVFAFLRSVECARMQSYYWQTLLQLGAEYATTYETYGVWSVSGTWPLQTIYPATETPQWRAWMDFTRGKERVTVRCT